MKKTVRLEAPDGGWGILVCLGMAMAMICILGTMPSFGLLFGDFLKEIGAETGAVAFVTSSFFWATSIAGLFSNNLFRLLTIRVVGVLGGILFFIGSVMQIYIQSVLQLTIAYGFIQGFGAGLIISTSYSAFNGYFVKKRVMMMGFCQTLIGIGSMFYPVVIQKLNEWYGFRGSLLVLAAINSHIILGMLLMQPVEWHMKKVYVIEDDDEKDGPELLLKSEKCVSINSLDFPPPEGGKQSQKMGSYVSLSMMNGPITMSVASVDMQAIETKKTLWQAIVDFLDLTLLKDPIYLNITLGVAFCFFSDMSFFTLQPIYLFELNYTKMETAKIIAIGAAADMISRVVIALSAFIFIVSSRSIYLAGAFFSIITRFGKN